jgi:hypothetical protein
MGGFFAICNGQSQLTTLSKPAEIRLRSQPPQLPLNVIEAHRLLLEEFSASDVATLGFSAHRVCHFAVLPLWAEDLKLVDKPSP